MSTRRIAIIGAGPCGLATAKWMIQEGMEVQVFEMKEHLGGMWLYDEDEFGNSGCYKSLTTNTPKRLTAFDSFAMPDSFPTFPHHSQILLYLRSFSDTFGITKCILFQSKVTKISRNLPRMNATEQKKEESADKEWTVEYLVKGEKGPTEELRVQYFYQRKECWWSGEKS